MTIRILRETNACPDSREPTRMDFLVGEVYKKNPVFEAQAVAEGWAEYLIESAVEESPEHLEDLSSLRFLAKPSKKRKH